MHGNYMQHRRAKRRPPAQVKSRNRLNEKTLMRFQVLFVVACVAGFIFQSYYILSLYMQYKTGSTVGLTSVRSMDPPDTSVCIRYVDILREGGLTEEEKRASDKRERINEIQNNITLKQIFENTPGVGDIVSGCIYKIPDSYITHVQLNQSRCLELFRVTRFYTQEVLCYNFHLKVNTTGGVMGRYKYDNIATSLQYPALFYALLLNKETLRDANVITIVAHDRETLPFDDMGYSQYFFRQVNNTVLYNEISVFYAKVTITLLPPPYSTACSWYEEHSGSRKLCITLCLKNFTIEKFGKIPFTLIEKTPLDRKHISEADIMNINFGKDLNFMEIKCQAACGGKQCKRKMYKTDVLTEGTGEFGLFSIRLYLPMAPALNVQSVPFSTFQETLIYVSSSLGVWLGFSVVGVNPVQLWSAVLKKRQVTRGVACHCDHCNATITSLEQELRSLQRQHKKLCLGYDYVSERVRF